MSGFNCTNCKNNPGRNSFVTFKDGHIESILYFEKIQSGAIMFSTKSGVYIYQPSHPVPGLTGLLPATDFFKVNISGMGLGLTAEETFSIDFITLDERVEYKFWITIESAEYSGTVLVAPNARDEEIRSAILDKLGIVEWRPNEEPCQD